MPRQIANQFLAAGTSVGANLEEAKAAQSRRDLAAVYSIALKESRETSYWLRLMHATELVPKAAGQNLLREANEFVAILTTSRKQLRKPIRTAVSFGPPDPPA